MSKLIDMLIDLANQGYTIEELKQSCTKTLFPFFENKSKLDEHWTCSGLLSAFEFFIRYHNDEIFLNGLTEVLSCYRASLRKDEDLTIGLIHSTLFDFSQRENMMFTVRNNISSMDKDDLFEYTMQLMDLIGKTLEIATRHHVTELLQLIKIEEGKPPSYKQTCSLDFGVVIQNILQKNRFSTILKTTPLSIKLSDWRNIAYHHNYKIVDELITCSYGKKGDSFTMNIKDLEKYTHAIIRSSNILGIARCIFVFDNLDSIHNQKYQDASSSTKNITFRDDVLNENLRISLLSQYFLLDKVELSDEKVSITIIDLITNYSINDSTKKRRIHSSQFLFQVWCTHPKSKIEVNYSTSQEGVCFISSVNGNVCEEIDSGKRDFSYLAKQVDFKFLHKNC